MNITVNTAKFDLSKYKPSTKTLLVLGVVAESLWQNQAVRDVIIAFIHSHPHWSGIATLVGGLWLLLHNPVIMKQIKEIEEGKE